jgi:paraquat-inducible protein B
MTRPSAALIGTFVLGALALVVAAVLFFGGGMLREQRFTVVSFFDASVQGLRVGAPVTFRGVPVGEVKSMGVRVNPRTGQSIIQVNMELVPGMVTLYGQPRPDSETLVASLVSEGLTAQLVKQSFVTGLLSVELSFRRGAEVSRLGDTSLLELPTVPGDLEGLAKQLQTVDIAAVLESLQRTLAAAEAVLNNPGLGQALGELPQIMRSLKRTLGTMEREVGASSTALQETLGSMRTLAGNLDRDTAGTLGALRETLDSADATLRAARELVDPRGHNAIQVQRTLDDLAAASARLRNLAERVDRDPSVLVRGR